MRIASLTLLLLALAPPAAAAENGVITGTVINETTGRPAAGTEVRLSAADQDGSGRITRTITTGRDGSYRFANLPAGEDWLYVVDATFDDGVFPGSPFSFPPDAGARLDTTLKVWNTTSDPAAILVARDAMFVLPTENAVDVVHSVSVVNQTDLAYIGRGGMAGRGSTTLGFGLPSGAINVGMRDASLDVPELTPTDFGFGITVAIPPGEARFTYTYRVPADGPTYVLSKTALYPTAELLVFVGEPLVMESDRLREGGTVTVDGEQYRRWSAPDGADAGDTVLLQATAQADIGWFPLAIGGALVAMGIALVWLVARRRKGRVEPVEPPSRDELVAAIATLDVRYESGSLAKEEWETEREILKRKLVETERIG